MPKIHIATYCGSTNRDNHKRDLQDNPEKYLKSTQDVVIRLGGSKSYSEYPIQINSAKAILRCIDKLGSKVLLEKADLNVLPTRFKPVSYPCVVKGVNRSEGSEVFVVKDKSQFELATERLGEDNWYVEPLFDYTNEYRLHCTQKRCFFSVEKIKEDKSIIITAKNHHNVRSFNKPDCWAEIERQCIAAGKKLGLDIWCVDVGYSSKTGEFIIHELNSNPELLRNTFNAYIAELQTIINEKEKK